MPTESENIKQQLDLLPNDEPLNQTLGWLIGEHIRNNEGCFDEIWGQLAPRLKEAPGSILVTLFNDIIESGVDYQKPGRAVQFLDALTRDQLIERVSGSRILLSSLAMGKEFGGRRVKHMEAAWPICLGWARNRGQEGDEKLLVENLSFPLIDLAMRGPLQRRLLTIVLQSTNVVSEDVHTQNGGMVGVWARVVAKGSNTIEEPEEALDELLHWGEDVERRDEGGHTAIERIFQYAIDQHSPALPGSEQEARIQAGIDALVTTGAQWEAIERDEYESIRHMVYSHPRVKSQRLGQLAKKNIEQQSKPKM